MCPLFTIKGVIFTGQLLYLTFSDMSPAGVLGHLYHPHKGEVQTLHSSFGQVNVGHCFFLLYMTEMKHFLSKSFCLTRLSFFLVLLLDEQVLMRFIYLFIFLSVPVGISGLPASLAPSRGYIGHQENSGKLLLSLFSASWIICLLFSIFQNFPVFALYILFKIFSCIFGAEQENMFLLFAQEEKSSSGLFFNSFPRFTSLGLITTMQQRIC